MARCRRPLPPEAQRILRALAEHLRVRVHDYGWTHAALAGRLQCDRSRVSHALAPGGEEMPSRRLIQEIARILDAHAEERRLQDRLLTLPTMRRWYEADSLRRRAAKRERQERRRATATHTDGAPPASMTTYQDLLHALNALVIARYGSQRAMCRIHTHLGRPVVSAALGGRRSLRLDLMGKILRACGVRDTDHQAWEDAWRRLGSPHQQAALERQRAGYTLTNHGPGWQSP